MRSQTMKNTQESAAATLDTVLAGIVSRLESPDASRLHAALLHEMRRPGNRERVSYASPPLPGSMVDTLVAEWPAIVQEAGEAGLFVELNSRTLHGTSKTFGMHAVKSLDVQSWQREGVLTLMHMGRES